MSNNRAFQGIWIPAELWLDEDLTMQEKVMLVEINSLSSCPNRGCYKSNKAFSEFFSLSVSRISEIITSLNKKGYIEVRQKRSGKQVIERNIFPKKGVLGIPKGYSENAKNPIRDSEGGYSENTKESNTLLSNTGEGNNPPAAAAPSAPACPYDTLVNLYHETLPELPQVRVMNEARKRQIRTLWKQNPDLEWWAGYFNHVKSSDFLCGRVDPQPGRSRFVADIEWITKQSNLPKILEGARYHQEVQR